MCLSCTCGGSVATQRNTQSLILAGLARVLTTSKWLVFFRKEERLVPGQHRLSVYSGPLGLLCFLWTTSIPFFHFLGTCSLFEVRSCPTNRYRSFSLFLLHHWLILGYIYLFSFCFSFVCVTTTTNETADTFVCVSRSSPFCVSCVSVPCTLSSIVLVATTPSTRIHLSTDTKRISANPQKVKKKRGEEEKNKAQRRAQTNTDQKWEKYRQNTGHVRWNERWPIWIWECLSVKSCIGATRITVSVAYSAIASSAWSSP